MINMLPNQYTFGLRIKNINMYLRKNLAIMCTYKQHKLGRNLDLINVYLLYMNLDVKSLT